MRLAVLPLDLSSIAEALQLPETHQLIAASYDMERQRLSFLMESDEIPETQDYAPLPYMALIAKVETGKGFRKTTVTPTILGGK